MLGDEPLLRHMLRNLLENAVHHGGGLEVRIVLRPPDATDTLTVRVEDAGPGIPEAERERVFAPFYRVGGDGQGQGHGHGVGLALVRQVARYHGGEARHLPRPGGGSAFEARLPRRGPPPATASDPLAPRERGDG
jgi:signal transduction histidine kinase